MPKSLSVQDEEWAKKHKDIYTKGITSIYWPEVLDVIKFLEKGEHYEDCQELWEYYLEITGERE